ncbi:FAD-binding oxidoreductase [archaeon]|jgi:glycolate oxidase|nr:FAD-binding oxidoreductase [archaeon]
MANNKAYEYDASGIKGTSKEVFLPITIAQTQNLVKTHAALTPRGGGTGLSGGAIPNGNVIIDLSKLKKIGELDTARETIEVEAGVILDDLQLMLEETGLEFPVNPSSHGICTIGGMIATDAVGSRALKYGPMSKNVRWIEIINNKGEIERKGATEISDYSGLEGTTGIIIKACLNLVRRVKRSASIIPVKDTKELLELTHTLKNHEEICAIEFVDDLSAEKIGLEKKYHIIAEFEGDTGKLKDQKYIELFKKRDTLFPIWSKEGYLKIEDPKLHPNKLEEFLNWLSVNKIPCFGHISVGIVHPRFRDGEEKKIKEMIRLVKRLGGQISGEHGIGILKKEHVDPQDKRILLNIKKRLDPNNKFNPGKII